MTTQKSTKEIKDIALLLLKNNDVSKYFIEYNGFFSNHMSHVLIALYRMGASEHHLHSYVKHHVNNLEKTSRGPTQIKQESELKWKSYYEILGAYKYKFEHQYGKNIISLVANEFPALANRASGAALHGLIHLGYGFSILDEATTCEGLAYLEYAGAPFIYDENSVEAIHSFGQGTKDILALLQEISTEYPKSFKGYLEEEVKKPWIADNHRGNFQNRMKVGKQFNTTYRLHCIAL